MLTNSPSQPSSMAPSLWPSKKSTCAGTLGAPKKGVTCVPGEKPLALARRASSAGPGPTGSRPRMRAVDHALYQSVEV